MGSDFYRLATVAYLACNEARRRLRLGVQAELLEGMARAVDVSMSIRPGTVYHR